MKKQISFQNLKELLTSKGIAFEVITHKPVFSMEDVLRELNIPEQAMAKTLLVTIEDKGVFRAVVPGTARLDINRLASAFGVSRKSIRLADKKEIEETGFILGAIPPFGGDLPTCIDKSLLSQDLLYCGAGENDKTFSLKPQDIVSLSSAITADITEV